MSFHPPQNAPQGNWSTGISHTRTYTAEIDLTREQLEERWKNGTPTKLAGPWRCRWYLTRRYFRDLRKTLPRRRSASDSERAMSATPREQLIEAMMEAPPDQEVYWPAQYASCLDAALAHPVELLALLVETGALTDHGWFFTLGNNWPCKSSTGQSSNQSVPSD